MIHLSANGFASDAVLHALFELGCRIARPFAVHRSTSTIPSDGWTLAVGDLSDSRTASRQVVPLGAPLATADVTEHLLDLRTTDRLVGSALALLGFVHEDRSHVDRMGRTPADANALVRRQLVHKPWLELIAEEAWRRLRAAGCPDVPARRPWSTDQLTLCLTHDVDGPELYSPFATARAAFKGIVRRDRFERESFALSLLLRVEGLPDPYFNFDLWRELEGAFGGRSTFFVYPGRLRSGKRHANDPRYDPSRRRLRRALCDAVADGCEVGAHIGITSHGSTAYHEARVRLQEITGAEIVGTRTHYWVMDWHDPYTTWREMAAAGFAYDMSLSPLTLGFRGGFLLPICPGMRWGADDPASFTVVPSAVMDAYAVPRDAQLPAEQIELVLDDLLASCRERNGVLVLDWHERTLINRGAWSGYLAPLCALLRRAGRQGGFRLVPGREVAREWRAHVAALFGGVV